MPRQFTRLPSMTLNPTNDPEPRMTSAITPVVAEIPRDRYGRPLVVPPGGGKPEPYTRCTTYVSCLEDTFNLQKWMQRMVATGLSMRPDLMLAVSAHKDDKRKLDGICDEAREAAAASSAATTGTALHALTETIDRGHDMPVVPDAYVADLAAYTTATEALKPTHIEQFCVLDTFKIGGTPDRVVTYKGKRYIADVKTGSIEYGALKIAMQLAVYARSHTYDHATAERGDHGAELDKGIVIHLPAGTGRCELHWIDLVAGWEAVKVARMVRDKRAIKFNDLTEPFTSATADTAAPTLVDRIQACGTADEVRALWSAHAADWTDAHTAAAKAHIASLGTAS